MELILIYQSISINWTSFVEKLTKSMLIEIIIIIIIFFFFGVPHSATFIFVIFLYVIASIAYIHPVYGAGVRTHDLLNVSRLP
jgi:hypothetical protein